MTAYLLPCSCGKTARIEPRQAGETVRCECGRPLSVPTMLDMAVLEPAEPLTSANLPARSWGLRQGLSLAGIVVCLLGLGLGLFFIANRPTLPSPDDIRQRTESLTPMRSLLVWREVCREGLRPRTPQEQQRFEEAFRRYHLALAAMVVVSLAGLGLIVVPLVWRRRGNSA